VAARIFDGGVLSRFIGQKSLSESVNQRGYSLIREETDSTGHAAGTDGRLYLLVRTRPEKSGRVVRRRFIPWDFCNRSPENPFEVALGRRPKTRARLFLPKWRADEMEIFHNLTDDQLALLGCAAALVLSGTVMALSYFIGRARKQSGSQPGLGRDIISPPVPNDLAATPERRRVA